MPSAQRNGDQTARWERTIEMRDNGLCVCLRGALSFKSNLFFLPGLVLICFVFAATKAHCETLFSPDSPWNKTIPATATFGSVSVAAALPVGLDTWDPKGNWVIPYYTTSASDPQVRILYNAEAWLAVYQGKWHRSGNAAAVEAAILASSSPAFPYPGNVFSSTSATGWVMPDSYNKLTVTPSGGARFYVPASVFAPAAGADGHMAIRQPSGLVLETYGTILLSDRTLVALSYSVTDPGSLGDGWQRGQTASMLPSYAGAILDGEINSGIKHAMSVTVPPKLLTPRIAYPAYAFDRDAMSNGNPYSGNLPMGARLALPAGMSISQLQLTTKAGLAIATAAQKYGFLIVDRGGEGITLRIRPTQTASEPELHRYDTQLSGDLMKIFAHLKTVTF
jgi:hypothetical protein